MTKPLSLPDKKLTVRLPETDHRRIKSVAARLGLSLQEVVHEALEAWVSHHDPRGTPSRDVQPPNLPPADAGKARQNRGTTRTKNSGRQEPPRGEG